MAKKVLTVWFMVGYIGLAFPVFSAEPSVGKDILQVPKTLSSGHQTIKVIDDFSRNAGWKLNTHPNVEGRLQVGYIPLGLSIKTLRLELLKKNFSADAVANNYFTLSRKVTPDLDWEKAEGIRFNLATREPVSMWMAFHLTTRDGSTFQFAQRPIAQREYSSEFSDRLLPFRDFIKTAGPAKKLNPLEIQEIMFEAGAPVNTLYFGDISLYRVTTPAGWLIFKTNAKDLCPGIDKETDASCNTFERGAKVVLKLIPVDNPPAGITGFIYEIQDYYNNDVTGGTVPLTSGKKEYAIPFIPPGPGYYEIRVFGMNNKGEKGKYSCLLSAGTMPAGMGTFAVMPATIAENIAAIKRVGEKAFFGSQGHRPMYRLHELMGFPWVLQSDHWAGGEKDGKPDRPDGMSKWVKDYMKENGPRPTHEFAVKSFTVNLGRVPDWAKRDDDKAPGFKNWEDYLPYVRDSVRYHKNSYPHMKHRVYEPCWEISHNRHPFGQKPYFTPAEVVELHKQTAAAIKSVDPDALVVGPTSYPEEDWFESLFKAGLLDYLDGVSLHFYCAPPPEGANLTERLAAMRALMRKYAKRELPIYNTEAGYQSLVGSSHRVQDHARWNVRHAIIFKGEGVRTHLAFFFFDFSFAPNSNDTWGFCFNSSPGVVHPKEAFPKPTVPALAVCSHMLLDSTPVQHLRWWGKDIWGYVFENNSQPVLVLWEPYAKRHINVPVGDVRDIILTNIMGHQSKVKPNRGVIDLEISPDPIYITGASKEIYLSERFSKSEDSGTKAEKLYPGLDGKLVLTEGNLAKIREVKTWGWLNVRIDGKNEKAILASIPKNTFPGPVPVYVEYIDGNGKNQSAVKWLLIGESVEIKRINPTVQNGWFGLEAQLISHSDQSLPAQVSMRTEQSGKWAEKKIILNPKEPLSVFLPLQKADQGIDPAQSIGTQLAVEWPENNRIERGDKIYSLCAYRRNEKKEREKVFTNHVHIAGPGSSNAMDEADIYFNWDDQNLKIRIESKDDVFHQTLSGASTWVQDSIQLAFDSDPDCDYLYDFMAGRLNKKITEITLAHTPKGNEVYRHRTHNPSELPQGSVSTSGIKIDWRRNEQKKITTYLLTIPWPQIGLASVYPGKNIGISLLINDSDGEGTPRKGLELFSGIYNSKDHRLFGRLILR